MPRKQQQVDGDLFGGLAGTGTLDPPAQPGNLPDHDRVSTGANPCAGERTIAAVTAQWGAWVEGQFTEFPDSTGSSDRKVTITRDCGHSYQWSAALTAPLPNAGDRAMSCLGPPAGTFVRDANQPHGEAYFDPRKRPVKKRLPRKGDP